MRKSATILRDLILTPAKVIRWNFRAKVRQRRMRVCRSLDIALKPNLSCVTLAHRSRCAINCSVFDPQRSTLRNVPEYNTKSMWISLR